MVIVYESKTGFTKKYADMLSQKTGMKVFPVKEFTKASQNDDVIFLGWLKAGKIQGLSKMKNCNIKAVCASGTGRKAEPSEEAVAARNKIQGKPLFYLRGGCLPIKQLKGADKILLSIFLKMLKSRKDKDEDLKEAISNIENGFDGVKPENLAPVLEWLNKGN